MFGKHHWDCFGSAVSGIGSSTTEQAPPINPLSTTTQQQYNSNTTPHLEQYSTASSTVRTAELDIMRRQGVGAGRPFPPPLPPASPPCPRPSLTGGSLFPWGVKV